MSHAIKVTVILKDFSAQFYEGFGDISGFLNQTNAETFAKCKELHAGNLAKMKIGNGSFRDQVDLNQMLRRPHRVQCMLEPRRGYKLATFTITTTPP